ncbi:MAG: cytidine/deoxycytidylate deaminase family protein [Patescibacteria group bacterium]
MAKKSGLKTKRKRQSAQRNNYISWDECFMRMAHVISDRSKDPNTQAGAVLVDANNVVVGLGYNGFPRGVANEDLPWKRDGGFCESKYAYIVHAEENAIYNANARTKDCILYCTLFPCNECAKTIIQNGVKEIVYESDKYHDEDSWIASRKMLDLAGVKYRQYKSEKAKK